MTKRKRIIVSDEERALTNATIRVSDWLGIPQKNLASVIGVSESTVSRMRDGSFILERGRGKAFELAQLLLSLCAALDSMTLGDQGAARAWLVVDNSALRARPIDLIQSVHGLVQVVGYLRGSSSR